MQILHLQQPQIGRDLVATGQQDDVARNQPGHRNSSLLAVAPDGGILGNQPGQRGDLLASPVFLDESDDRIDEYRAKDDGGISAFVQQDGQGPGRHQHPGDGIVELRPENRQRAMTGRPGQAVGPMPFQAPDRFRAVKTLSRCLHCRQCLFRRLRVPGVV